MIASWGQGILSPLPLFLFHGEGQKARCILKENVVLWGPTSNWQWVLSSCMFTTCFNTIWLLWVGFEMASPPVGLGTPPLPQSFLLWMTIWLLLLQLTLTCEDSRSPYPVAIKERKSPATELADPVKDSLATSPFLGLLDLAPKGSQIVKIELYSKVPTGHLSKKERKTCLEGSLICLQHPDKTPRVAEEQIEKWTVLEEEEERESMLSLGISMTETECVAGCLWAPAWGKPWSHWQEGIVKLYSQRWPWHCSLDKDSGTTAPSILDRIKRYVSLRNWIILRLKKQKQNSSLVIARSQR